MVLQKYDATQTVHAGTLDAGQISGIYGPGSWAAWILATISSLCVLRHQPDNSTILSMIPPSLYINWVAIDLIKQVHATEVTLEAFASATGIVFWGIWYFSIMSHCLSVYGNRSFNAIIWKLRILTFSCSIVPAVAILTAVEKISRVGELRLNKSTGSESRPVDVLNELSHDSMPTNFDHWFNVNWTLVLLVAFFAQQTLALLHSTRYWTGWQSLVRRFCGLGSISRGSSSICIATLLGWTLFMMYLRAGYIYRSRNIMDINGDRTFCLLKTCGPQSLTESDQGLSLCCGILLFGYEVGSDIWSWVVKVGRGAQVRLQSCLEST